MFGLLYSKKEKELLSRDKGDGEKRLDVRWKIENWRFSSTCIGKRTDFVNVMN